MQPAAPSGIVWKISIFLFVLLAVVLYKMNDYFKQEKYQLAQSQLRTQIVSIKTSVSSQLSTLKNVLSSYEMELTESKINWVQLDPFFGIAKAERVGGNSSNQYRITQFIGRSGSHGVNWNAGFLQQSLSQQVAGSNEPITVQLFQDGTGAKFISLRFSNPNGRALMVVGSAEYFQKYFDVSRGGKMTALLETSDHILAAHSEADYLGSPMDEGAVSDKKFVVEKEDIAGTNLIAMNFMARKDLAKGFAVPWSVVGLIIGFGLLIVGVLIYTLEPIERRIEKYRMQEREQIFKDTLITSLSEQEPVEAAMSEPTKTITTEIEANPSSFKNGSKNASTVESVLESVSSASNGSRSESIFDPILAPLPNVAKKVARIGETKMSKPISTPLAPEDRPTTLDETYILAKANVAVSRSGTVFLDADEFQPLALNTVSENENLELDKILALDDLDSEEVAQSRQQYVQDNLTSKKIKTSNQMAEVSKPVFSVKRKDFKVDAVEVVVRRPDRS